MQWHPERQPRIFGVRRSPCLKPAGARFSCAGARTTWWPARRPAHISTGPPAHPPAASPAITWHPSAD